MTRAHRPVGIWALGFGTMCLAVWLSTAWWALFWICLLVGASWVGWDRAAAPPAVGSRWVRSAAAGAGLGCVVVLLFLMTNAADLLLFGSTFNLAVPPLPHATRFELISRLFQYSLLIITPSLVVTTIGAVAAACLHTLVTLPRPRPSSVAARPAHLPAATFRPLAGAGHRCGTCGRRASSEDRSCPGCGTPLLNLPTAEAEGF